MGGSKPTFVPFPTFVRNSPADGQALSALGRCRVNPLTCTLNSDEFHAIIAKNIEQANVDDTAEDQQLKEENKKLKKKYMKQGVAMAQSYLMNTLQLDVSIVCVEILIDAETIIKTDGCIVSCFLDAGCDKIAVSGDDKDLMLQALDAARVPRERLVAHLEEVAEDIVQSTLSFVDSLSVACTSNVTTESCKHIITQISKGVGESYNLNTITVHIQVPSSTDADIVASVSSFCAGKETPMGTLSLVDPSAHELGMAYTSCIRTDRPDGLYTTVVCTRSNEALGLVYSSKESVVAALECGRGVYYSRSRNGLWRKGDTSGHYQTLHRIDVDCDGDALRFTVTQRGEDCAAFCHLNTLTCWGEANGLRHLEGTLKTRLKSAPEGSYTKRLFDDSELLRNKLVEEAQELAEADDKQHVAEELADVLYFAMTQAAKFGVSIDDAVAELDKRARKVTRRPGNSKAFRIEAGNKILKK